MAEDHLPPFAALLTAAPAPRSRQHGSGRGPPAWAAFSGVCRVGADGGQGLKAFLDFMNVPPVLGYELLPATVLIAIAAVVAVFFTLGISVGGDVRAGRRVATAGHKAGQALDRGRQLLTRRKAVEDDEVEDEDERQESPRAQRPGFLKRLFTRSPARRRAIARASNPASAAARARRRTSTCRPRLR